MERAEKLRRLNNFRRSLPHASASALSAILGAIQKDGLPEGSVSRPTLRQARDQLMKDTTPYGTVVQLLELSGKDGVTRAVPIANPFALIYSAVRDCAPFREFMKLKLEEQPPSPDAAWSLVLYSDEVTPGNPLSTNNKRKFHAVYFSFLEFGTNALSREESWFTVVTEYSTTINDVCAGLSQLLAGVIKVFFDDGGFNLGTNGILLPVGAGGTRLWARLGGIIQDGAAHKSTWSSRGDGASKMCLLCKNLFVEKSNICEEDGTNLLCCNVIKHKDLVPASSQELRKTARYIARRADSMSPEAFTALQQSLGMTYQPCALLLDAALDKVVDPVNIFLHDWMHGLFVDGVFNICLFLMFEVFIQKGFNTVYAVFSEYVSKWTWPLRTPGSHLHEIFSESRRDKHRKAKHIKAQASDLLSLCDVSYLFTLKVLMKLEFDCANECKAFLALIDVVQLIVASGRVHVEPADLLSAVEKFLQLFSGSFGFQWMTPKFHWLLHIPDQLRRSSSNTLLNCFCLERKHRVPKRYATEMTNVSKHASKSLLMEVTCHHMGQLSQTGSLVFSTGLVDSRPPSKKVRKLLMDVLKLDAAHDIAYGIESRFCSVATCKRGDVVLFRDSHNNIGVAKVQLHCEIEFNPLSMVSKFVLHKQDVKCGFSVWKPSTADGAEFIETCDILDTVLYQQMPDGKIGVYTPWEYRK